MSTIFGWTMILGFIASLCTGLPGKNLSIFLGGLAWVVLLIRIFGKK